MCAEPIRIIREGLIRVLNTYYTPPFLAPYTLHPLLPRPCPALLASAPLRTSALLRTSAPLPNLCISPRFQPFSASRRVAAA